MYTLFSLLQTYKVERVTPDYSGKFTKGEAYLLTVLDYDLEGDIIYACVSSYEGRVLDDTYSLYNFVGNYKIIK